MAKRLKRAQSSALVGSSDVQIAGPNLKRIALIIDSPPLTVSGQVAKGAIGSALSGATTGVKLLYTVGAGVQGYLQSVSWVVTAGTPPVVALQLIRAAVTYMLINPLAQGFTSVSIPLRAGDIIQLNVVTLGAGAVFDATINAVEDQLSGRVTISFIEPAVLDQGINIYPGDPPLTILDDHFGQSIVEPIRAIGASGTATITVLDIMEEDCGCGVGKSSPDLGPTPVRKGAFRDY